LVDWGDEGEVVKGERENDKDEGRWTMDDGGQKIRSSEAEKVRGRKDRKMRKWEDGRGNDTDEGRGTMDEGRRRSEISNCR
jgi:hypothetical protein